MKFKSIVCVFLLLSGCGGGGNGGGSNTPADDTGTSPPSTTTVSITEAFAGTDFSQPVFLTQISTNNDRWFVVEREGRIREVQANGVVTGDLIDIRNQVDSSASESGLLGFAFHPDFDNNGQAYLSYTRNIGGGLESVVTRVLSTDGGSTLNFSTEAVLLSVIQDFGNHNGGHLAFGPDGFLYISFGDGGSGNDPNNRSQTTANLMGNILRINIDEGSPYSIPADNPFAANALCSQGFGGASCPEIFAWGLRNPWRFSFDETTGEMWVGDVGQNRFEEVDRVTLGGNYGWRIREGANCNIPASGCDVSGLIDPHHEYGHDLGQSITGGYVYRGSEIPSLVGTYVFGDFVSGRIWTVPITGTNVSSTEVMDTNLNISSFAQGNNNELYVVDFSSGIIFRLE